MEWRDRVVLVTGGGSGIGAALATAMARQGARLVLCGRRVESLRAAAESLPDALALPADIADPVDRARLVAAVSDRHGRLDVLVNNAAVQYAIDFRQEADDRRIAEEIAIDLLAPITLARAFLPLLATGLAPTIVNLSSPLGLVPKKSAPVYCAAKAGLHAFSRSLRAQLAPAGIRVVEVFPPLVETAMTAGRGRAKITPDAAATAILRRLARGGDEMWIGRARLLRLIDRLAPALAFRLMRDR